LIHTLFPGRSRTTLPILVQTQGSVSATRVPARSTAGPTRRGQTRGGSAAPSPRGTVCVVLTAPRGTRAPGSFSSVSRLDGKLQAFALSVSLLNTFSRLLQNRAHSRCSVSVCRIREKRGLQICGVVAHFVRMDGVLPCLRSLLRDKWRIPSAALLTPCVAWSPANMSAP